uniref:Uncharacterized protein n=1 Tax=Oryza barthii TaxID=65489 RepID=A0A0D3GZD3_9ORYZ
MSPPLPTSSAIRPSPPARRRSLAAGSPNRRNRPHTSAAAHPGHRPSPVFRSPFIPQPDPVATPSVLERGERGAQADLAGGDLVVCVTCKCGVHKEFGFDHSH